MMTGSITSVTPIGSNPFFLYRRWISPNHMGLLGRGKLLASSLTHSHKHRISHLMVRTTVIFHFNDLKYHLHFFPAKIRSNDVIYLSHVISISFIASSFVNSRPTLIFKWNWQSHGLNNCHYTRWHTATYTISVYFTLQPALCKLAVWFVVSSSFDSFSLIHSLFSLLLAHSIQWISNSNSILIKSLEALRWMCVFND